VTPEPLTLFSRLRGVADQRGDAPALVDRGRVYGYRELFDAIESLAAHVAAPRREPPGRIALVCPNGADFVAAFFAILRSGGIVVPVNPALSVPELTALLGDARASQVVTTGALRDQAAAALRSACGLGAEAVVTLDRRPPLGGAQPPPAEVSPHAPALYLYSSGSTGRPKRVERSHAGLLYETERLVGTLGLGPEDRILGVTPFTHINGLARSMVAAMLTGAALVTLPQFERRAVGRAIQEHAISVFIGVPFMFGMLADTRWPSPVDFSSLRWCFSASAPLRSETSRRFRERYGVYVRQIYGTTETGTIAVNLDPRVEESIESVGTPLEGVVVDILAEDGRVLPSGATGEIGIRSPAAAREYPGLPDETGAAFVGDYFLPGDIGHKDARSQIYLVGRKSLFINRSGYKVNPREVEAVLERHPKVREAAVVGVTTEYGDQKVKAVLVVSEPCRGHEIVEFCRGKIADFKVPSIVEFRPELPKSAAGKILRASL